MCAVPRVQPPPRRKLKSQNMSEFMISPMFHIYIHIIYIYRHIIYRDKYMYILYILIYDNNMCIYIYTYLHASEILAVSFQYPLAWFELVRLQLNLSKQLQQLQISVWYLFEAAHGFRWLPWAYHLDIYPAGNRPKRSMVVWRLAADESALNNAVVFVSL